jgi:NarL family two-component system sensor histidine kinase YdfH
VALFAVHLALHLSLGWRPLVLAKRREVQLLYFGVQGLLVLSLSVLGPGGLGSLPLSSGLYLVLLGEAIIMVQRTGLVLLLGGSYLLLDLLGFPLRGHLPWDGGLYLFLPLLLPFLPFAVGYVQTQARARDRKLLQELSTAHAKLAAAHAELETAHRRLATSAGRIEELTRLTERQRLARDLHDTLAQGLSGLILQLEVTHARLVRGRAAQAQALVQEALQDARQMLGEAREAIDQLRAASLPSAEALERVEQVVRRFTTATGIPCTTDLTCLAECPAPLLEPLVRILREGLLNIARHAHARQVWIAVREADAGITLEVRDDGIGIDPASLAHQDGHYGLLGMRERARLLGGSMDLTSTPGSGTHLCVRLPYGESREEP